MTVRIHVNHRGLRYGRPWTSFAALLAAVLVVLVFSPLLVSAHAAPVAATPAITGGTTVFNPLVVSAHAAPATTASTITVGTIADAFVNSTYPNTNFGSLSTLNNDASPVKQSFVRFNTGALNGTIVSAKLHLYVTNGSADAGGTVKAMSNTTWSESSVTYNTRPSINGVQVGQFNHVAAGAWLEYNVTPIISAGGSYSFGISQTGDDEVEFAAREHSTSSYGSRLVITTSREPTPSPTSTPTPTPSATPPTVSNAPCGEQNLAGRTDIVFCEGYESSDWPTRWNLPTSGGRWERVTGSSVLHGQASLRVTLDTSDWISRRRYAMLPTPQDGTLYYRWYHKVSGDYFTDDSVAIKGNALYGWKPGQTLNYATESDGTNHFSTRASANRNMGGLHLYYYGANGNVSKGADVTTDYQPDRWTCVEIQLTPNTVTNQVADKNGEMRLWVNGRLIHSITGIVHRTTDALKLQMVDNVDRYNSGAGIPGTLVKWEDNLVVAKNRIGCMP